jgi:hypothetical protein
MWGLTPSSVCWVVMLTMQPSRMLAWWHHRLAMLWSSRRGLVCDQAVVYHLLAVVLQVLPLLHRMLRGQIGMQL